ncbi:tyrosine-type recombinase/integrase [Lactobacillus helveticus]|uniref:tyrosine-type recombinase/integrase n=1 Tax=Lactobacillus helveticus TaxID=1587 RepID=UPI0013FE145E|nr:site-specific integrase [Lactobacillus helveticus]MCT3403738.1 site-specific integrase [Lactobacillus helveticus]NHL82863.1 site-specific integrase [Lactobacillus helveticus]
MNNDIKEYTTPSGKKRYKFAIYVGKSEATGESIQARKRGFKSYEDALKCYALISSKIADNTYTGLEIKNHKVSDVYRVWLESYKDTVKTSTLVNVKQFFKNHILKDLGSYYIERLTPFKCQRVAQKWALELPKTFNTLIIYSNKLLDYAVRFDYIRKNPMRMIIKPKKQVEHKEFTDFYTKQELNAFLKASKNENIKIYTFFRLLAYSGMRKGEALALKWSDIDFTSNTISINKTVSIGNKHRVVVNNTTKTKRNRAISMDARTMQLLKEWRFQQRRDLLRLGFNPFDKEQVVFQNFDNEVVRPNLVAVWNKRICDKNGLRRIKIHGFRHTHASLLFNAGVPMEDVKQRLGHASIQTTMDIYTHVTKDKQDKTALSFAQYMEN